MEQSGLSRAVGFFLAVLFAAVMGMSLIAVLVTEYMEPGRVMGEQARLTLRICGIAGALAALLAWWLQRFAARRGFAVRFFYALVIFLLAFGALGGLLGVISNFMFNPGSNDFSLTGLYWASVGGFYTFVLFLLGSFNPGLLVVLLSPGIILALVGPREIA
ncbi:hypothetical protein BMS3Bbin10_00521 [bacterium BMS3Bbin10]|nr:hypothetical protein BMS3Bbin10_00521 [bacterium BMS3Bbin10]